ncbi:MAG: glucuronate isomerase [Clostridia bacterium]|nr:glucuronate isomerase [Clostridia bacterium]
MKQFMDKDFLLETEVAKKLFHEFAAKQPIIDYHCHLNPKEISEDRHFNNITEIMLGGDHYKWRAMRSNAIPEDYMTGDKDDFAKFEAFASTLTYAIGNPLFHWTHLELQRFFGIDTVLSRKTAREIYDKANKMIASDDFSARRLIEKSNVETICTTDDPIDTLEHHIALRDNKSFKVLPTFRPDKAVNCELETFVPYIADLEKCTGKTIRDIDALLAALTERIEFFNSVGCRLSDHALAGVPFAACTKDEANRIFKDALAGATLSSLEIEQYKTFMLLFFAAAYHKHDWAMQIHIGAVRNNNSRMYAKLGPDTGFDSVDDKSIAQPLARLLNASEEKGCLPKTILYTLNPKDNYVIGTMLGNFQGTEAPSKIQFGSGWWFNDQRDGMVAQMSALANLGLLGRFVGMLTDSRSFLSYPRFEYFRRILCNLIGGWVENGEYPADYAALEEIITGISYRNAKNYFKF